MTKSCLIFNSAAGSADRATEAIHRFSGRSGAKLFATEKPGDAARFAQQAVEQGFERLIVAGGDGTFSQVVAALAPDFGCCELGLVPLGTGNDLARSLAIGDDGDIAAALQRAQSGPASPIDLAQITNGETIYMVNAASGGIAGKVAADVDNDSKYLLGPFAYWLTAVSELAELQEYQVELTLDDRRLELELYGLFISNGRFVGGGFEVSPRAQLDDGLLDLTAIPVMPALDVLAAGMNFALGYDQFDQRLETYQAARIHLKSNPDMHFSIDGEPKCRLEATFEVIPQALRVVAGGDD